MQLPFLHQAHSVHKPTHYDPGVKLSLKYSFLSVRSYTQISPLKPEFYYTLILYEIDRLMLYFIVLYIDI